MPARPEAGQLWGLNVHTSQAFRSRRLAGALLLAVITATVAGAPAQARSKNATSTATTTTMYVMERLSNPDRTVVSASGGAWLATFTDGARTVTLAGARRTFAEATTTAKVSTSVWVRLLPKPFTGTVNTTWLSSALSDPSPDLLAIAMQYVTGAPTILNGAGLRIAGDASYGPLQADGTRLPGSDFNDYLGVAWAYPSGSVNAPEAAELSSLDCSGFVRMVFGYRSGVPLALSPDGGTSLSRHSWAIAASGPGVVVIPNAGSAPASRSALQPGDVVAFDASATDGTRIDHVGIFLGRDSLGHDRFISSRRTADGPTLGDLAGRSALEGTGLYAVSFRTARRI